MIGLKPKIPTRSKLSSPTDKNAPIALQQKRVSVEPREMSLYTYVCIAALCCNFPPLDATLCELTGFLSSLSSIIGKISVESSKSSILPKISGNKFYWETRNPHFSSTGDSAVNFDDDGRTFGPSPGTFGCSDCFKTMESVDDLLTFFSLLSFNNDSTIDWSESSNLNQHQNTVYKKLLSRSLTLRGTSSAPWRNPP